MKQSNCTIYTASFNKSNRKNKIDSCIEKADNEINITYCENDTFDKFENDFNDFIGKSKSLFNIKKSVLKIFISFVSIIVILFALLSVSIYEDLLKKIIFEMPFEWRFSDWVSTFFVIVFIFGLFLMPSLLDGEDSEFKELIYSWFNKDIRKIKRLKAAISSLDRKQKINLYNFDLENNNHWIWKVFTNVIVNKFQNISFYVRNDQVKSVKKFLDKYELLTLNIVNEKDHKPYVNYEVLMSTQEKSVLSMMQLCSTKIINRKDIENIISLELFEFSGKNFIKNAQDSTQLVFGFQNFINRSFDDFNLLIQKSSNQVLFSKNMKYINLAEEQNELAFYLRNHIEECVEKFENPISLLILYYYVKDLVLDEKRLIRIIEKLIITISNKQDYELIQKYWFDIAGEMFDCEDISSFEKQQKTFYRNISVDSLNILSNLFERNGYFNQAILINKYLFELNPITYGINISSLHERMGNFELALNSLPKTIEKSNELPLENDIRFLQRKLWIIVSQRNLELKEESNLLLEKLENLLFSHKRDNKAIWLWHYYNIKANFEEWNENYDEAIKFYEKCLSIPTLGSFEYGATFVNMAIAYRFKYLESLESNFITKSIKLGKIGMNLKKSVGDRDEMPVVIHNYNLNVLCKLSCDKNLDILLANEIYKLSQEAIDILDSTASIKRLGMLLIENYISADLLKKDNISVVERLRQHINLVDANELNQLLNTYKQFIKTNKITSLDFLDEKIKGIE
ncbi:hypothetical protein GCM10012288_09110 [Malaciobacter pacificus]|uniref:Putative membrane protein n=1 Tax=Malaciobacter pacificus TaxID=1080223 RepID=A0A5C2H8U3_9BACT|nr:hypothetical protein [Malaciobacter pacificus]QEP34638.1 putative membrane protein [Malaciobacter pacificus]GGD37179.1 hypothetical protein GCM10012288_09110 [Malaciobacter pacificus]